MSVGWRTGQKKPMTFSTITEKRASNKDFQGIFMAKKTIRQVDKKYRGQVIHRTIRRHRWGMLYWKEKHYDLDGRLFGISEGCCPRGDDGIFPELFR
jgi:hypothetical protein